MFTCFPVAPEYELLECGLPKSADGEKKLRVLMTGVAGLEDSYSIGHKVGSYLS